MESVLLNATELGRTGSGGDMMVLIGCCNSGGRVTLPEQVLWKQKRGFRDSARYDYLSKEGPERCSGGYSLMMTSYLVWNRSYDIHEILPGGVSGHQVGMETIVNSSLQHDFSTDNLVDKNGTGLDALSFSP